MDKEVLETKLEALIRCVHRIKDQKISTLEELESNLDKQEIIILNLQRAVHQYENIDCNIVLSIIKNHLEDFKEFAKAIGKLIK